MGSCLKLILVIDKTVNLACRFVLIIFKANETDGAATESLTRKSTVDLKFI